MKRTTKILLLVLLACLYVLISNIMTARDSVPLPVIGDFSAIQAGKEIKLEFSFRNIVGGIEYAEAVLETKVTKKDGTNPHYGVRQAMLYQWIDYNIVNVNDDPTRGTFEFVVLTIPYNSRLIENGDIITFTIRLTDEFGGESNKVECMLHLSSKIWI